MSKTKKDLIPFQQQELDAVIMYRALASKAKNEHDIKILEELATCEGKHAALLKQLTECKLKPRNTLKNLVLCSYHVIGKKLLFKIMAKVEKTSYNLYKPFFQSFPITREIAEDEMRHGEELLKMID